MGMGMPIEMERNFPVTQLEGARIFVLFTDLFKNVKLLLKVRYVMLLGNYHIFDVKINIT